MLQISCAYLLIPKKSAFQPFSDSKGFPYFNAVIPIVVGNYF